MISIALFHCVSDENHPSGELQAVENEKKMLVKRGYKVDFFKYSQKKPSSNYIGRRLQASTSNFWSQEAYNFVKHNINKFKPDITHFHGIFPYLSISSLQAARDSGKSVIPNLTQWQVGLLRRRILQKGKILQ